MPRVASITVYPIKSLPGISVDAARVLPSGALEFDRRWALVDDDRSFVNAKRTAAIHGLDARFDLAVRQVSLSCGAGQEWHSFDLDAGGAGDLEAFLGNALRCSVRLVENAERGLPDDNDSPGPTIVSRASFQAVASWFPGMSVDEARRRFRANIEIAGEHEAIEPFWEDRLCAPAGRTIPFRIGEVALEGTNPCQRCVVPSRDPSSGAVIEGFARRFSQQRERTIPAWAPRDRFDHFYRLAVNTRLAAGCTGGTIRVGDGVVLQD